MKTIIKEASLVLPNGIEKTNLAFEDGIICSLDEFDGQKADKTFLCPGSYVTPGFIDLQANGGGGHDFSDGTTEAVSQAAGFHLRHGTTTLLPTLITQDAEQLRLNLQTIAQTSAPNVLGCHIEGPFISPVQAGVHPPEHIVPPDRQIWERVTHGLTSSVMLTTVAPELSGADDLIRAIQNAGVRVAIGHSDASYDQSCETFDQNVQLVTHLFNAMRGFHHREPGVVGATLDKDVYASLIADNVHLRSEAIRLAAQCKGSNRICLITDAISATGTSSGRHRLGSQTVNVQNGQARLDNDTLAGSILTLKEAVRNALDATGWDLPNVIRMATLTPAEYLGIGDRKGKIAEGYEADLLIVDRNLNIQYVFLKGKLVHADHSIRTSVDN